MKTQSNSNASQTPAPETATPNTIESNAETPKDTETTTPAQNPGAAKAPTTAPQPAPQPTPTDLQQLQAIRQLLDQAMTEIHQMQQLQVKMQSQIEKNHAQTLENALKASAPFGDPAVPSPQNPQETLFLSRPNPSFWEN